MKVWICLDNKNRNIIQLQTSLTEEDKKQLFGSGILGAFRKKTKTLSLNIESYQPNGNLVCKTIKARGRELPDLLYAEVDGEKKRLDRLPVNVTISRDDAELPFKIYFDPNGILDCTQRQSSPDAETYKVRFTVSLRDPAANDKAVKVWDKVMDVAFNPIDNKPKAKAIADGVLEDDTDIQYDASRLQPMLLARIDYVLPLTYERAQSVDLWPKVEVVDQHGTPVTGLIVKSKDGQDMPAKLTRLTTRRDKETGKPVPVVTYYAYLPMSSLTNPQHTVENYKLIASGKYAYSEYDVPVKQPVPPAVIPFGVVRNDQQAELQVDILRRWPVGKENMANAPFAIKLDAGNESGVQVPRVHFQREGGVVSVGIRLSNKAIDRSGTEAGVRVSRVRVDTAYIGDPVVEDKNGNAIAANSLVSLRGLSEALEDGHEQFLPNDKTAPGISKQGLDEQSMNAATQFNIVFNPKQIYSLRNVTSHKLLLCTTLEFDYEEDVDGRGARPKHYRVALDWQLEHDPNPEWLGIDYGSSAIVCYFSEVGRSEVIDLSKARTQVYNESEFPAPLRVDEIEAGTRFLSSDIVLHDVHDEASSMSALCSQNQTMTPTYDRMAVLLSPTSPIIIKDFRRQLPCLKILMGNEKLPPNVNYRDFEYDYIDNDKRRRSKAAEVTDPEQSLMRIDTIFREAYHTLFNYFIRKSVLTTRDADGQERSLDKIQHQINKIVLTYPNTYTPRNLKTLKGIVERLFTDVREVKFVSESDAVAAYYMSHWSDYHTINQPSINERERVLVYDMGAGTLDLTYMVKTYSAEAQKYILEIKGKIGTGKAGNYLDYVLAEIIAELTMRNGRSPLAKYISTDSKANDEEELNGRITLKNFIKHRIKPLLDTPGTVVKMEINGMSHTVEIDKVVAHPKFQAFLKEATSDLLARLQRFAEGEDFGIDTVIMSGRSLRLGHLRAKLQECMGQDCTYIMLDNVISGPQRGKPNDRSKTAVVEGARIYAENYSGPNPTVLIRSRRMQASYGVAFQAVGGQWMYYEVLGSAQSPFACDNSGAFQSPQPVTVPGTNAAASLRFIQTYLSEADTRQALNNNDLEFIQTIGEVAMTEALRSKSALQMSVHVDHNNSITLEIDGHSTSDTKPKGVSLSSEVTKRGLWPVSIL